MGNFQSPVSIFFVWHPADAHAVEPIVQYCSSQLQRDIMKPFSRAMNLPIFYRTSTTKNVPSVITLLSQRTIIFPFVGKEVAADQDWSHYIEHLPQGKNTHIIPISLDNSAFTLKGALTSKNFIRTQDYDSKYVRDHIFIAITHEIYRCALNESFKPMALGKDNALKIFLSHAKDGKHGIKIALALREFISNSSMRNFFDATDIAPGYEFDKEIIGYIKESTLIAIHSDPYSSRYWCQREILSAKENNRPIVAVDCLDTFEDRRFPFASNIPGVHVHLDDEPHKSDLLRILTATLLETVRFFYSRLQLNEYRNAGWFDTNSIITPRPPEVSDIEKIYFDDGGTIKPRVKAIIYPEPPVYAEELTFLSKLGMQLRTPLSFGPASLNGAKVGISISDPSEEDLTKIGQVTSHLIQLSQDLARHLLGRGAILIYGGDLRPNGFTEFIFTEAQALQARLQSENIHLINYIAWPIYNVDTVELKNWKARYRPIAKMVELAPPADAKDLIPGGVQFLPPTNDQNSFVWSRSLTEMRKKMIRGCGARISAGGKHSGYKGIMPGVLEEILITIKMKRPLYLLGGFGGVTASVCHYLKEGVLEDELTLDWQVTNNAGYKGLIDYCAGRGKRYMPDYEAVKKIKMSDLNNGLSDEDNYKLFSTPFIDEALHLVLKGFSGI